VLGPLIASRAFFNNIFNLNSIQYVYLGIAVAVGIIAIEFLFAKIPEVSDKLMLEQAIASGDQEIASCPLHKQRHLICGFIAQFIYVAAQVTLATSIMSRKSTTYLIRLLRIYYLSVSLRLSLVDLPLAGS
jgi:MFS transporter, FHS family, L-fucose permease